MYWYNFKKVYLYPEVLYRLHQVRGLLQSRDTPDRSLSHVCHWLSSDDYSGETLQRYVS